MPTMAATRSRTKGSGRITHADAVGAARMVDVAVKESTVRHATAEGRVRLAGRAFAALRENRLAKGDAIAVARLAGLQAAKRTAELIPLCHQVPLDHVDVRVDLDPRTRSAVVRAETAARWSTGVEMEAMVAVAVTCLTIYDMTKGVARGTTVESVHLVAKSGGRSGTWRRAGRGTGGGHDDDDA